MLTIRFGALAAITGAVLAILGNTAVLAATPAVPVDTVSYPLSTAVFGAGQVGFAVAQALMALGVVALVRSGIVGGTRLDRVVSRLAVVGMALTVPGELVLIPVAGSHVDSAAAAAASSVFGLGVLLGDIGLIGVGVQALRQRRWVASWAAVPIALGAFQLLVVTPVSLALGFASPGSFIAIALADLLTVLLGVALLGDRSRRDAAVALRQPA